MILDSTNSRFSNPQPKGTFWFDPFDPLEAKQSVDTEVAANAIKREIKNILNSYVGWFDPFCELIQNALDSVEERKKNENADYHPELWITINIHDNSLTVTENGIGLNDNQFRQFLAPNFSFKSGKTRGHKGVGATYIAYGFNHIRVYTKTPEFKANGKMIDARNWLGNENPSGNPKVKYDDAEPKDPVFSEIDRGVSIYIKFDSSTHPKDLKWIKADKAKEWFEILSVKTGLGAVARNEGIKVNVIVIDKNGNEDVSTKRGIGYNYIRNHVRKACSIREIQEASDLLYKKRGKDFKLPPKYFNLDVIHESWITEELKNIISLDEDELAICEKYNPRVDVDYAYSAKVWNKYNESLRVRSGYAVLSPGIQIAADNMPQGEVIQIPLSRNIGRQNQIHFLISFENCSADLGRKGFHREITDFSKEVSRKICDGILNRFKYTLRPVTGIAPDLLREQKISEWKRVMDEHEKNNPLVLINENFFLPSRKISMTSLPTREQDVIALFNQMVAGGVIRGIKIMSTNERFTYDGLYRIVFDKPNEQHLYDEIKNPLGVLEEVAQEFDEFRSDPKILEYKYSLDGLIENFFDGSKNASDIELAVVWKSGNDYEVSYSITSLLIDDNLHLRQFHGVTHTLSDTVTGQQVMSLIVLSDLISFLSDPETTKQEQIKKYDVYY